MEVYESKVTGEVSDEFVERFYWGHAMEKPISKRFIEDPPSGLPVDWELEDPGEYTIYRHSDYSWAMATLDRIIVDANGGEQFANLQLKNASAYVSSDWNEGIPVNYRIQVQWEMFVKGLDRSFLAVLIGGNEYRCYQEERDQKFIDAIIPHVQLFWDYVQSMTEPPADSSESCARALYRLHPDDSGESIALAASYQEVFDRIEEIKTEEKALQKEKNALNNRIKAAIGGATFGTLANGARFSWKTQERKETVQSASKFRVLRLHPAEK
jgi:predicted phage-related endonuclease